MSVSPRGGRRAENGDRFGDRTMIRDLGVVIDGQSTTAGPYALSLAKLLRAHLTAVSAVVEPDLPSYAYGDDLVAFTSAERHRAAHDMVEKVKKGGHQEGLEITALALENLVERSFDPLNRIVRLFDLVIAGQGTPDEAQDSARLMETIVFGSGRPTIVVPYIQSSPASLTSVLVAWDGSAPAARALADAVPLLAQAGRIELLCLDAKVLKGYDEQGTALTQHLARHRIDATFRCVPTFVDIGNALLSRAADMGADLLVMGAYGHSRLREAVFGGVTRTLLNAMTIPVLMSR
jgi:nucleotide-binding universal stress UspA family protein